MELSKLEKLVRWDTWGVCNGDGGVSVSPDSPLWDLPPDEAMAVLREAKGYSEWATDQAEIQNRRGMEVTYIICELAGYPDQLAIYQRAKDNPFLSGDERRWAQGVLHAFDRWQWAGEQRKIAKTRKRQMPTQVKREVIARDGHRCRYCGAEVEVVVFDHVYPFCLGGLHEVDNLVVSCRKCNSKKKDRELAEAGMVLLPVPSLIVGAQGNDRSE